jgi:hypothetical protein
MAHWLPVGDRKYSLRETTPPPLPALLLVTWQLYKAPNSLEYQKTPPQTGGYSYFLIENCNISFIKTANKIYFYSDTFLRNRCLNYICAKSGNHIRPQPSEREFRSDGKLRSKSEKIFAFIR